MGGLGHAGGAEDEDEEDQQPQEWSNEHGWRVDIDIIHVSYYCGYIALIHNKCVSGQAREDNYNSNRKGKGKGSLLLSI